MRLGANPQTSNRAFGLQLDDSLTLISLSDDGGGLEFEPPAETANLLPQVRPVQPEPIELDPAESAQPILATVVVAGSSCDTTFAIPATSSMLWTASEFSVAGSFIHSLGPVFRLRIGICRRQNTAPHPVRVPCHAEINAPWQEDPAPAVHAKQ